jgi:signal transduction histidine kinase
MEMEIKPPFVKGVLVVDDDDDLMRVLLRALELNGYCCHGASDAPRARTILLAGGIDLVICDIFMPEMGGLCFMESVKVDLPDIDFIIMTGCSGDYSYFEIVEAGAADYMAKPFKVDSVIARIRRIERERRILFDLKTTNNELAAAMEEVEEVSLARGDFLARMSHEIRTPLNSIMGYTDILLDTGLSDEQEGYVENTKKSCDVLLGIVNEILDISRIEAGEIGLAPIEFDPELLCFECLEMVRSQVNTARVELLCRICDCVPGYVVADPNRFRQVLLNLLGNAAKFTETGVIELSLSIREGCDQGIMVCACVCDTGMGIPESALEVIFEPFRQIQGENSTKHGGTGLGLSICRKIARCMGGEIKVESREGEGSLFEFSFWALPVEKQTGERIIAGVLGMKADRDKGFYGENNKLVTTHLLAEQAKRSASILLVDDNPVNRRMAKIMLLKAGYRVTTAENGRQTLDLYQDSPDLFDLILMDINMPEMDGFETTRQIRIQEAVSGTRIPIVAFTANVLPVFKERCAKAGMDDLLTKPFKREDIFEAIKKWVV